MDAIVRYILTFLLYGNESAIEQIAYVPSGQEDAKRRITIVGNEWAEPLHYPSRLEPEVKRLEDGRYEIDTDIVYNTFFFISRAEEVLNTQRDAYGRFLAQYSMLGTDGLQMPWIDEYSRILMKLLDLPMPEPGFAAVYLTHDIDTLTQYRHLRGALGGICRRQGRAVVAAIGDIHRDPVYTFPWMIKQDARCLESAECRMHNAQCIYFVKHTSGKGIDYPQYRLQGKDYHTTVEMLTKSGARLGVHSSAYINQPVPKGSLHRSHYLCCSIERMQQLVDAGYTDDYSMGFADWAGFRLQTTRAVRWINPKTRQLTSLTMHPLTLMDCTLSQKNYMNLSEEEAYDYAAKLIEKIREYHGEVVLLWHNSVFTDSYHTSLYPRILSLL